MLLSCKNEEELFHSLQFDTEGIELTYNSQSGTLDGTIPANGSSFTISGKGDFSEFVYVSSIKINGIPVNVEGINGDFPRPQHGFLLILNGEWGKVEYLKDTIPYAIELRISPNNRDTPRCIDIQLGHGYWCSHINLYQDAQSV